MTNPTPIGSEGTMSNKREYNRIWRQNNKERCRGYSKKWHNNNLEHIEAYNIKRLEEIRLEICQLLGNRCSNPDCPIPSEKMNIHALQIDHIFGGGTKERRKVGAYSTYLFNILKAIKSGSKDYQLLCAYCNWLKRYWGIGK